MTLAAAILIFGISSLTSIEPRLVAQSAAQSQSSASAPATQAPASKPKASTAKKTHPKKKAVPAATCDPAAANSTPPGSESAPPSPQPGAAQTSSTPDAPKPCPPPKIIVRQGGISEQSIQLAGGAAGDGASQKREAASRMLATAEDNLKKIAGRLLSSAEQDSVAQIRQFVDQSKSALAAGNLERAQTLAWKAKLLSDDLVNPQK
jgi:hypothetical protein